MPGLLHDLVPLPPGAIGAVMLVAGVLGGLVGLLAAAWNRKKIGFFLGVPALLLATTAAGLGAIDVVVERSRVDAATANVPGESSRLRQRRAGYEGARGAARAGLVLGTAALFGGLAGVLAPLVRRRRPRPQSMRMPRSLRSQARHEMGSKTGVSSLSASALATIAFVVCAVAWTIPLPGPALDTDDPAWDAREAMDLMRVGRTREGCEALEHTCAARCEPEKIPDLASAVSECFELRLGEAEAEGAPEKIDALSRTSLPLTVEQRQRVREELAAPRATNQRQ